VDIDSVVQQFVVCSQLAVEAGFHGVQIHAAHGYLLTQFLTAETNHRTDAYGGTPEKRAKIVDWINSSTLSARLPRGFLCFDSKKRKLIQIMQNALSFTRAQPSKACPFRMFQTRVARVSKFGRLPMHWVHQHPVTQTNPSNLGCCVAR
jgi:hypothetical protein